MDGLEELGRDALRRPSSMPQIKRGPNRGRRRAETGGRWMWVGGYGHETAQAVKGTHAPWLRAMRALGHRVGCCRDDTGIDFYVWHPCEVDASA